MQASKLEWLKANIDGTVWSTCGNYQIVLRQDRYRDVFQRVPGTGDVKLNESRLSLKAAKEVAQAWNATYRPSPLAFAQASAESRTKAKPIDPRPAIEWSLIEQVDGNYTHWYTKDTIYRVSKVSEKGGDKFAACYKNDGGHLWPIECDPPRSTHPKYYNTLLDALSAAEKHFVETHEGETVSNLAEFLKALDDKETPGYNCPTEGIDGQNAKKGGRAGSTPETNETSKNKSKQESPQVNNSSNTPETPNLETPKEPKIMLVTESRVRKLFKSMGYTKADNWSLEKLTEKTNEITSLPPEARKPAKEEDRKTFAEIYEALTEDDVVKITQDSDEDDFLPDVEEAPEKPAVTTVVKRKRVVKAEANGEKNGTHEDLPARKKVVKGVAWREAKSPRLVELDAKLAKRFVEMARFPRDRELQENRLNFLRNEIKEGRFRGCEWSSCHVKETGETYRVNGKHTSKIFHEMFVAEETVPEITILVREYECDTMEEASQLFATFDAKVNSRSKSDVIRGFAVSNTATADLSPRLLNVLTAAVSYGVWQDGYRKHPVTEQAALLIHNAEFVEWAKTILDHKAAKHMVRMSVVAAMLKTWEVDPEAANEFWTEIRDDSDAPKNAPQRVLYRYLQTAKVGARDASERVGEREVLAKCLQAWNAYRDKESTVKFRYSKEGPLPEAK